ncbi:hypothetical protein ZWY2020_042788 [Hordeum vulgare]|nr:hypothetical protein ZWY2020_042788 [Hordeum vulgare]
MKALEQQQEEEDEAPPPQPRVWYAGWWPSSPPLTRSAAKAASSAVAGASVFGAGKASPGRKFRHGKNRLRQMSKIPVLALLDYPDEKQVKAELGEEKALPSSSITPQDAAVDPPAPDRGLNRRIVVLTTLAAVGLFGFQRLQLGGFSLKDLAANVVPYEEVSASWPLSFDPEELCAQLYTEHEQIDRYKLFS